MKRSINWMLAAILVCGLMTTLFTSCSKEETTIGGGGSDSGIKQSISPSQLSREGVCLSFINEYARQARVLICKGTEVTTAEVDFTKSQYSKGNYYYDLQSSTGLYLSMKDSKGETVTKEVYRQGDQIYFDGVGYGVRIGDLGADDQKIIDLVFNSVKRDATAK
jgi:hypothetical protein